MSKTLLPCPFCGSEGAETGSTPGEGGFMQCPECGAAGPIVTDSDASEEDISIRIDKEWDLWNKREYAVEIERLKYDLSVEIACKTNFDNYSRDLKGEIKRLKLSVYDFLKQHEWREEYDEGGNTVWDVCLFCGHQKQYGHTPNCELSEMLKKVGEK